MTLRSVGSNGGHAAAFTYDLAKSIVETRQGNPAWAGQERDGTAPIRSDDLFFGNAAGDPQPDWVNLNKVAIPQADEQQHLLANLIGQMSADREPLPRFWFLPRDEKAAVVMTGDDHGNGGTAGRFDQLPGRQPVRLLGRRLAVRARHLLHLPEHPDLRLAGRRVSSRRASRSRCTSPPTARIGRRHRARFLLLRPALRVRLELPQSSRRPRPTAPTASPGATGRPSRRSSSQHGIRFDTNYYYWPRELDPGPPGDVHRLGDADALRRLRRLDDRRLPGGDPDDRRVGPDLSVHDQLAARQGARAGGLLRRLHRQHAHRQRDSSSGADAIVASAQARGVPVVSAAPDAEVARRPQQLVVQLAVVERQQARLQRSTSVPGRTDCGRWCRRTPTSGR